MRFELRTLLIAAVAACGSSACSPSESSRTEPQAQTDSGKAPAAEPASETETDSGEVGEDEAIEIEDDVIEIDGPEAKRGRNTVPVKSISLTPKTVEWRERERLADANLELVTVATGVVARSPAGVYTLDDDEHLVVRPGLTLPEQPLLGHWPSDVWYVEAAPIAPDADGQPRFNYQLFQLDHELQWSPKKYGRRLRWSGPALAIRKGWLGGVLVREGSSLTRIGNRKDAPKVGIRMGKVVLDVVESSSGRLYNISLRPNGIYVQQACFTQTCVEDHAKKLPFGSEWSFATQIPRQRHSLSMLTSVEVDGAVSPQLLHYETGGWSLETLVHEPTGMWPTADGGLWLLVRDELRYRTPQGEWFAIAAPKGAGKLSVAIDTDLTTLWVATRIANQAVLFTTPASPPEDE